MQLNADLSVRAVAHTREMQWTASPSGSVWRKRVHLAGAPEAGQVTSVVRYEPNSSFPAHDHPMGEEILVLDGVFSDEHGDWPAGTYLLNPEGFRHAPYSTPGCLLFVKLRQFPGIDRHHVVVDTSALDWTPVAPGLAHKLLYSQQGYSDQMRLERWGPASSLGLRSYDQGAELFVLGGAFADEEETYRQGSWLRLPPGSAHRPRSKKGCTLYVKSGGARYLASGAG